MNNIKLITLPRGARKTMQFMEYKHFLLNKYKGHVIEELPEYGITIIEKENENEI